jgi:DMSO/TMAO reductase YedYZ heme-binding membrane subunit
MKLMVISGKLISFRYINKTMSSLLEDYGSINHIPLDIAFRDAIFIGIFSVIMLFILFLAVRRGIRHVRSS